MKILIASDTYYPNLNGASYFTYRLATLLAKRGHEVSVICPSQKLKETKYIQDGVKVYGAPSVSIMVYKDFRFSPLFLAKKAIKRFVSEIKPDVIHIQNHFFIGKAVLKVAKEQKIPIMGTNHFMPENLVHYLHMPKFLENKIKKNAWNYFFKIYNNLDLITTPTRTAADLIKQQGFKKEIIVVSCGINLQQFKPGNGSSLKSRYNIPKNRKIILYTGRLDKEKRIDIILYAMLEIIKMVDAHLVLAGKGKLRHLLEKLANKLGINNKVTFTGFIPDKEFPRIYHLADVFINAGIAELQSIVTMEALASGLPVVAVNVMALPELVHNGENGYLFPMDNSKMLADCVIKILSNNHLRKMMAIKSLEIIQKHNIRKVIKKYESLYQELILMK